MTEASRIPKAGLLFVYAIAAFTTVLNITMMSPLLVPITEEFSRSEARVGQLSTITAGFAFATALLIAPLLDRFPRRLWLRAQAGILAASAILTGLAASFAMVVAGRALAGIGGAIIIAICYASAADNFPLARHRHRVVGMISSAATLGSIIGLPILSIVSNWLGWRWAVGVMILLSLVLFAGAGQLRESPQGGHTVRVADWARRYQHVLAQRAVSTLLGVMILILILRFGWFVYLGAYAEKALRINPSTLGIVFAAGGVAHMIGSNAAPILLTRYSTRRIAAIASSFMVIDLASVGLYSDKSWAVFPFVVIFSACWAICFVSSSILLLELNPGARNTVSALQSAAMEFGIGAGAAIGGLLLSTLNDYERAFRSLALVFPVVLILLAATSPDAEPDPAGEQHLSAPSQAT